MDKKIDKKFNNISYIDTDSHSVSIPILILHGWQQNKESWMPVTDILSKEYRVICPDLPGFGNSKDEKFNNYFPEDYANDIYSLLQELKIDKVTILAHSLGGRIAISLNNKHPRLISNLILYAAAGIRENSIKRDIKQKFAKFANKTIPDNIAIKSKLKNKFSSSDYLNSGEMKQAFLNNINFNVMPYLNSITAKTLILWGDDDKELPIEIAYKFQHMIIKSEIKILKGYGHFAHIEAPQLLANTVLNFLKENG